MSEDTSNSSANPSEEEALRAIEEQMSEADGLIKSLEAEVSDLRGDLARATEALEAAQEEVSARGQAVSDATEARERSEAEWQKEIQVLRRTVEELRNRHADEQLKLRNDHINELSNLRTSLEEQRRADLAAAGSEERFENLREEFRREREAIREQHAAEMESVKVAREEWEEKLRTDYRELEERHSSEVSELTARSDTETAELQRSLQEEHERVLAEERASSSANQEATLQALRNASAGRELELQKDYQSVVETLQSEVETLQTEMERRSREAEETSRAAIQGVKRQAENRERELRRAHATQQTETNEAADRRVAALQAQREADNRALVARREQELARTRREYEERLATEDDRRKNETWALEERLEVERTRRDSEVRAYAARLTELESDLLSAKTSYERDLEKAAGGFGEKISTLESRVAELEDTLQEVGKERDSARQDLGDLREQLESGEAGDPSEFYGDDPEADERLRNLDAQKMLAEERAQDLERQLRETHEENRRNTEDLENALAALAQVSDPEHRLRAGLELFNASEHTRTVASISKSLGLPSVHAGVESGQGSKPVFTFIWGEMDWRRYVADPTEGVEEPRVYLVGTGGEPANIRRSGWQPNARMDARGRLILGVQAR